MLRRPAAQATRSYSESATEKPSDSSKPAGESAEAPKSEGDTPSALEAELKAKAAEVVDITVRLSQKHDLVRVSRANLVLYRAVYAICKPTS